jgi:tetratricopeptide (TPR) repeat protein/V8-like Glu-specific endopeptidase
MPFIDPPDSSQVPIDGRKIFIGRRDELKFFEEKILVPERPAHNIISISGDTGVGKSTLVEQFIERALTPGFREYCIVLRVGERQVTPISMMEKIAEQLHAAHPLTQFEAALSHHRDMERKSQLERDNSLRNRSSERAGVLLDDFSANGGEEKRIERVSERGLAEYGHRGLFKETEQTGDPLGELTKMFVSELNQLANTAVPLSALQTKHQRRVLLFFDPFEKIAGEAVPWLLDYFLEAKVSSNIVLIMAGHAPIQQAVPQPQYRKRWLQYWDKKIIYSMPLRSFSPGETEDYLTAQNITDPGEHTRFWKLTNGLPLALGIIVSNPHGEIDLSKEVVDNYLSAIPEHEEVKRRLALDAALFSKPFNQDDLEALPYINDDERPILYRWLTTQPFVSSNPEDGRYTYHEQAKEWFIRYLYQAPKQCQLTRKALAEYYQRSLANMPIDKALFKAGRRVQYPSECLELVIALVTQLLLLPDEADHISAIEHVLSAYQYTDAGQDKEIMKVLQKLSTAEPANQANVGARQGAERLLRYIEADQMKRGEEFLAAAGYLIGKVAHTPSFPAELIASMYQRRGSVYYYLDKNEQALTECNHALAADANYVPAHLLRGRINIELKRYENALIDLNRVLELDPENVTALLNYGRTHRFIGRNEEALHCFERVIEQNSSMAHQGYEEMGLALYALRRYADAVDAFTKALELRPTSENSWLWLAKTYEAQHLRPEIPRLLKEIPTPDSVSAPVAACRAQALTATGHYYHALEEFAQATAQAPKNVWFLVGRGGIYSRLERFEDALTDFTHALELRADDVIILTMRGYMFYNLGRYEEALRDFQQAIKLRPKGGDLFLGRGMIRARKGDVQEAMQDFDRAIELATDLGVKHAAERERGLLYQYQEKYQEASVAFIRALQTKMACEECWTSLAETYEALHTYHEVPALLREIPIDSVPVLIYRGRALDDTGHHQEALADLNQAIDLNPEDPFAYMSRGIIYYHLHSYEQALHDFDEAMQRNPDYKHEGLHWSGIALQPLQRYQEAAEHFSAALVLNPSCQQCWRLLARTYEVLYPRDEIPRLLREIPIPTSGAASIITYRAQALDNTAHYEEALNDFTQVIEIEPDNVKTLLSRAEIYDTLMRYEEALADLTSAIKLKPAFAQAIIQRGRTYRYMGRYEEALRDFDEVIKLNQQLKHDSQEEKGLVFYGQKKYQRSIETFKRALITDPLCMECWRFLARTYEALYPRSEVPRLLRTSLPPDAKKASIIVERANAMSLMGYYAEALTDLELAATLDKSVSRDDNFIIEKGLLCSYLGHYEKAIEQYETGLKQHPNNHQDTYNLAIAMICWQGQDKAKTYIDAAYTELQAIRYTDEHGAALYGLGGLEALLGNPDQALAYLQQALLFKDKAADWARRDIAWLSLNEHPRFQELIGENGWWIAYTALKEQSSRITTAQAGAQDYAISLHSSFTSSNPPGIVVASSLPSKDSFMHDALTSNAPGSMKRADIDRLVPILAKYAANAFEGSRQFYKALINRTDLPSRWKQEIADVWTGNANHDAERLITWSIGKGTNPENTQYTSLGSILKVLLPDVGLEDARVIATLIVIYHLYVRLELREHLAVRYQIPQMISADVQQHDDDTGSFWQGPTFADDVQLQSWLKPNPDMLDMGLLIRAGEQAGAVCQVELPHRARFGTGFLISPTLVVTNYHVLKFFTDEDVVENLRNIVFRFGYVSSNEDKEPERYKLAPSNPLLRWSGTDKLDYALLRLEDSITAMPDMKPLRYNLQPLREHMGMYILQHPEGETMKLAISNNGVVRSYPERGIVHYVTNARVGASGSPCFNEYWEVVALHHAERATSFGSVREGILFRSIYEEIKEFL